MNLPPEILQQVFTHLDVKTLKSCLGLSKDIRRLIINTPQLMRKLPVIFYGNAWQPKIPFVDQYGDCIRAITFKNCEDLRIEHEVLDILRKTKNLEELVFDKVLLSEQKNAEDGELFLPQLRKLSVDVKHGWYSSLKSSMKPFKNVKSLKMFHKKFYGYQQKEYFTEFLIQQNSLETLTIAGDLDESELSAVFPENFEASIKFKLKVLEVHMAYLFYHKSFANFLFMQSSTIQELLLQEADFYYLRLVLNHFRSLEKLSLNADRLLNDARIEEIKNLRMPNVTELNILVCGDPVVMEVLLNIFPNLEMLATELERFSLHGIIENMPKLHKLDLDLVNLEKMCFAKSASLQELKITNLRPLIVGAHWKQLAEDCPNIERLIIAGRINLIHGCIVAAVNKTVAVILENLKHFKKLQFCELSNNYHASFDVATDENREPEDEEDQVLRFLLESNADQPTKLSITDNFNNVHAEAIGKIVEEFGVNEVVVLPAQLDVQ